MFSCSHLDLLDRVQSTEEDVQDEIMEILSDLLTLNDNNDEKYSYRTYWLEDYLPITLRESTAMISQGTTGLTSWESAMLMAGMVAKCPSLSPCCFLILKNKKQKLY